MDDEAMVMSLRLASKCTDNRNRLGERTKRDSSDSLLNNMPFVLWMVRVKWASSSARRMSSQSRGKLASEARAHVLCRDKVAQAGAAAGF